MCKYRSEKSGAGMAKRPVPVYPFGATGDQQTLKKSSIKINKLILLREIEFAPSLFVLSPAEQNIENKTF